MITVSYSQFLMWSSCPFRYKLRYVDGNYIGSGNIHNIFGTSLHEVVQEFVKNMYEKSVAYANQSVDYVEFLKDRMIFNFEKERKSMNGVLPCTKEDLISFLHDGIEILKWFQDPNNLKKYYEKDGWSLVGVEVPIEIEVKTGVRFKGLIDIVLKHDTGKYKIIDIKSSTKGWNKYAKKDTTKLQQILLYKKFYSDMFGVKPEDIIVEFQIMKRKLYEYKDFKFKQGRIQRIVPSYGIVSIKRAHVDFMGFIEETFNEEGKRKTDIQYKKVPGKNGRNCKICEFADPTLGFCDRVSD